MVARPRTEFVRTLKERRCPKCGAKLNRQQKRCKRCSAETPRPRPKKKNRKAKYRMRHD